MPIKNVSFLERNLSYVVLVSSVLGTSFSQVIADVIAHVRDNDLEDNVWEDWDDQLSGFQAELEKHFEDDDSEDDSEDDDEDDDED